MRKPKWWMRWRSVGNELSSFCMLYRMTGKNQIIAIGWSLWRSLFILMLVEVQVPRRKGIRDPTFYSLRAALLWLDMRTRQQQRVKWFLSLRQLFISTFRQHVSASPSASVAEKDGAKKWQKICTSISYTWCYYLLTLFLINVCGPLLGIWISGTFPLLPCETPS